MKSPSSEQDRHIKVALFVLYLTMFLVVAGVGVITPLFPFFAKELGASSFELGLMVALFSLAQAVAAPLWGRLSDKVGRKPVLTFGLVGYAASFYLLIISSNLPTLLLARVIGGLLSASAFPSAQAYLVDLVPPERRGYAIANMAAASNLGFILGPTMGSVFAILGLRTAFLIGGSLILVTGGMSAVFLPTSTSKPPLVDASKNPGLQEMMQAVFGPNSSLLWVTMLTSFGSITMYSILGYYMIDKFDALTRDATLVYTLMGVTSVVLQYLLVGRALKRFSEDFLLVISLFFGAIGFAGLVYAPNLMVLYVWVVVIGASLALSRPVIVVALSRRTELGQGLTMGLQGSFDSIGRVIGPMWAGWIFGLSMAGPYWSSAVIFAIAAGLHLTTSRAGRRVATYKE